MPDYGMTSTDLEARTGDAIQVADGEEQQSNTLLLTDEHLVRSWQI